MNSNKDRTGFVLTLLKIGTTTAVWFVYGLHCLQNNVEPLF